MDIKSDTLKISKNVLNKKYLEIEGGEFLKGNIKISGAKNSALVLMAASILSKGQINLFNVPSPTTLNLALHGIPFLTIPFFEHPLKEYCNLGVLTCFQIR